MSRRGGGYKGGKPTWTTTSTSGVFGLDDVVELKGDGKWPRGPVAPTGLTATGGNAQVALAWTAPATAHGTITGYSVEYTPSGGSPTVVSTGSTSASYTVTGLTNGTSYAFRVAAVNHTAGEWSDGASGTPVSVITITSQPTNQAASGGAATFSVTATVTGGATLSYQWQKQEGGSGSFTNVSGATSSSLALSGLTNADDNGDVYRVVVSATGGAQSVTSDAATLTVAPLPVITITSQPSNQTASSGSATFSVTATVTESATLSYQWQKQEGGSGSFTNVSGATSSSLALTSLTNADDNGDIYRVVVSATGGAESVTSSSATLTVPAPSGQPDPVLLATFDGDLLLDQGPNNFWLESSLGSSPDYGAIEPGWTLSYQYAPSALGGAVQVGVLYGDLYSLGVRTDVGRANLGALISGGSFTVEMWYYPGDALSAVYWNSERYFKIGPYVVAGMDAEESNADYGAPTYAYTGVYGMWWSPGSELALSATLLTPQAWNHVALVVDASESEVRLYINGSLACTGPLSSDSWVDEFQVGGFFGNEFSSSLLSQADDVRITASAIYSGSTISTPTRGTLTYSRTTNATTELLLNATHGIEDWGKNKIALRYEDYFNAQSRSIYGSGAGPIVSTAVKKFGPASYYMDGTVGGLHLVDVTYGSGQWAAMVALTDAIQDGPWTLEMWVRPTATLSYNATPIGNPEQSGEAYFTLGFAENEYIALYDNTYSGPQKGTLIIDGEEYPNSWLAPETISSGVTLEYRVGGVSQRVNLPTSLSRNAWHHLAVVADTAAGLLRLKVDGEQVGTIDISGSWASKGAGLPGIDGLAIGELNNHVAGPPGYNANTCNWFTGYIDEIRISSVALYGTGSYTVPAAALT